MRTLFILLIILAAGLQQACMDIASTGVQAVYNRHSLQKTWDDQYITLQANQALYYRTKAFEHTNITVSTYHREVLLAGQVPYYWQKFAAQRIIKAIPNVKNVYNLIEVETPSSTLTRLSDLWITAKVKAKMLASNDVDATAVRVVTENGVVYLMGILLPEEADAAIDLAKETDGVLSVVKMFSYIKISKRV